MPSSELSQSSGQLGPVDFDIYCVNDFHGSINEQTNGRYYESGIKKYFGNLQAKVEADPEHTIVLSTGDMFQGSFESNSNYGLLITEAMNAVPFDAMTLGNHEFDYGRDRLNAIKEAADFPILGGNIVNLQGENLEEFPAYTTFERGGYKFGIVGMIGEGQTSSITSSYVSDLVFANPEKYALAASKYLREQEGCDAIILTLHDDCSSLTDWVSASSLSQHFDGVFCGHSHTRNKTNIGGLTALQAYCNGEAYSHLRLEVSKTGVKERFAAVESTTKSLPESEEIGRICEKYFAKEPYFSKANATAGTLLNASLNATTVSDLACVAIYEKVKADHPNLLLAMQNKQRANVATGTVTYRDLYKAMPFMNKVCVVDILGQDIIKEAQYNETYSSPDITVDPNQVYRIAVIDYLLYHQNSNKRFDYFDHFQTEQGKLIQTYEDEYPVDFAYDYIKTTLGGTIDGRNYNGSPSKGFNVLSQA